MAGEEGTLWNKQVHQLRLLLLCNSHQKYPKHENFEMLSDILLPRVLSLSKMVAKEDPGKQ